MSKPDYVKREIKLTAAIYASKPGLVEYVKEYGCLPEIIEPGGFPIACTVIIRLRGTNIRLRKNEKLVYDAILREGRLPGGIVKLVENVEKDK
jgi:hypothetical protein